MKKILMIAYRYPPQRGSGVLRILKFTKYLPKFGWKPYVISVKKNTKISTDFIPQGVITHYTRNLLMFDTLFEKIARMFREKVNTIQYLSKNRKYRKNRFIIKVITSIKTAKTFFVPDVLVGWIPLTLIKAIKIIKKEDIELIYATSPVPTSLIIGAWLKKITKKPFIVDLRDLWTKNPNLAYVTRWNKLLESFVLKNADKIIVVTPRLKEEFIDDYPFLKDNILVLTNGFDLDDIPCSERVSRSDRFTITYAGTFGDILTPRLFLDAINKIIITNKIPRDMLQVLFIGSESGEIEEFIKKYKLQDIIKQTPHIPNKEAINLIFKSQLLLLMEYTDAFPNKVFEYLASGIPILALISKGYLANLIEQNSDNSRILHSQNIDDVVDTIMGIYSDWTSKKSEKLTEKTKRFREEYNREYLTKRISEIFLDISK